MYRKMENHLDRGEYKDALDLIVKETDSSTLSDIAWELVPLLCSHFITHFNDGEQEFESSDNEITKPDLHSSCQQILVHLASKGNPKELLVVLLQQVEDHKTNYDLFLLLLEPVGQCLSHLPPRRGHSVSLALQTLDVTIRSLPLPAEQSYEGKERLLLDLDEAVQRIHQVIPAYLDFMQNLVFEASFKKGKSKHQESERLVAILTEYLIRLLDHPLSFVDLSVQEADENTQGDCSNSIPPQSTSCVCAERCVMLLCHLHADLHKSIQNILDRNSILEQERKQQKDKDPDDISDIAEPIPALGLATLTFLIFTRPPVIGGVHHLPHVLSTHYHLEFTSHFVVHLLSEPRSLVVHKGLELLKHVLASVVKLSLSIHWMEMASLRSLVSALVRVMTMLQVKEFAQMALHLFKDLFKCFELSGHVRFLYFVLKTETHPGVLGYLCNLIKDDIGQITYTDKSCKHVLPQLKDLLKCLFTLPEGEKTDLMEQSDRIMGALNLLRYALLSNHSNCNLGDIVRELLPMISSGYCEVIRKAIALSRAHYELDIQKAKDPEHSGAESGPEVAFSVGGEAAGPLTNQQQLEVLQVAVTRLDMMESVLARTQELVDDNLLAVKTEGSA